VLKVGVVDDDVGQGTRFDLGEIHSFGHAVTAAVQAGRFWAAFWPCPVCSSCYLLLLVVVWEAWFRRPGWNVLW
jgi:hypothetical protein